MVDKNRPCMIHKKRSIEQHRHLDYTQTHDNIRRLKVLSSKG